MSSLEDQPTINTDIKVKTVSETSTFSEELIKECSDASYRLNDQNQTNDRTVDHQDILNDLSTITGITLNCDGNDSGVEIGVTAISVGQLQRAFSNNSGGYASSCGGLEEAIGNASCNSSLISCCSDFCDVKTPNKILRHNSTNDCTSEGGSESSSIHGGATIRRSSTIRKKVALNEPTNKLIRKEENSVAKSRSRAASANRAAAHTKATGPTLATSDRARSRDKIPPNMPTVPPNRSTPIKKPPKPDSLSSSTKDPSSPAIHQHRAGLCRAHSVTRGRTPGSTPTIEDGRWPSVSSKTSNKSNRGDLTTPENLVIRTKAGPLTLDFKSSSIDKYATLPRRRKEKSEDDFRSSNNRSSSVQRDKMTSSMIKRQPSKESTPSKFNPPAKSKKNLLKTKIYHETCVQTAITCKDLEDAFAGMAKDIRVESVEKCDRESQSDIRDKEIERLENKIKKLSTECNNLQGSLLERSQLLMNVEQQLGREREEKQALHSELKSNTERVMAMLELVNVEPPKEENCDSLLMLESQIQQSGYVLEEKQSEIEKLHSFCNRLQAEMQRSINVQQTLRDEREVFEKESTELQDFLQDEKSALMDALKEAEAEMEKQRESLSQKDTEMDQLRKECRHLVRISEQRRQEFLGMQSKYNALESRSKELIVQQSTAVSGASMALAGLGTRLDNLVDQLISSYNISEQELEDVIFHNEAYTNSASSEDASPDGDTMNHFGDKSPQRHQSFVTAVINAIRNAASSAKYSVQKKDFGISSGGGGGGAIGDESDSTEMLDSETEPCLMMEHVLEDVSMPDSHSHNMVSSSGMLLSQVEMPSGMDRDEESFHNLSQAIANRQRIELHSNRIFRTNSEQSTSEEASIHESVADAPSISDYCSAQAVVDQVIDVDNLVTKLLKVLRIIQMDNDNCIQQLIGEKNKLQLNKEEMLEKLRDWEELHLKLKRELEDASHQLMVNSSDLANSRIDLQRHRSEIDRLNVDICNLSTLCSQNQSVTKETILNTIKTWQESKNIPEPEIVSHIITACHEIPILREQLFKRNDMANGTGKPILLDNWQDTVYETKRQYDAIDKALETLGTIQTVVQQCPALVDLQRDLEETNFQSAGILPIYSALLNAAAAGASGANVVVGNGSTAHNGTNKSDCNANASANGTVQIKNSANDSPAKNAVDSTA